MIFFSIIIPVYQTEKYLSICIDSVLKQSFKDYEIILVDDGSMDRSPEICDRYALQYDRVNVIHKENGGSSDARNVGIKAACGEFLLFLDSDDFWDDVHLLKKLQMEIIKQDCDVLNYHFRYYYEESGKYIEYFTEIDTDHLNTMQPDDVFVYLVSHNQFIASAWNKAVDRELIINNKIYFRKGVTSEDIEWCARIAIASKKMGGCNVNGYCYRQRSGSITHTISVHNVEMLYCNIKLCLEYEIPPEKGLKYRDAYMKYISYQYGTLLFHINTLGNGDRKEQIKETEKYQYLLKFNQNKKIRILYIFNLLLGYKAMNNILRMYIIMTNMKNRGKENG